MTDSTSSLPIDARLQAIKSALARSTTLVLQADPGAGKTTRLPPSLLDADWLNGRRIILIEPRRVVVTSIARYLASQRREAVGETVGYRIRFETRVSARTRLEVVTAGIFLRMLQKDPELSEIGLVIFDEFHERSLDLDLSLALARQTQQLFRDDLRLLVMSATLESERVAERLKTDDTGPAPIIQVPGRAFPVETRYLTRESDKALIPTVVAGIMRALQETEGSLLVFLPGQGEIHRVRSQIESSLANNLCILPLYGELPLEQQQAALRPVGAPLRKVVLATSIAETSLTIPDITVVIDCGQSRLPRFDPASGMTRLETVWVSQASAEQRRGRAGRTGPGICYRLWTASRQGALPTTTQPEIRDADLTPLALELAVWGASASELTWLDPPSEAAMTVAHDLLRKLEALDATGALTPHGRRLADYPLHPRLAHMIERSGSWGAVSRACQIAALLSERDLLKGEMQSDLGLRLQALESDTDVHGHRTAADPTVRKRVLQMSRQFGQLAPRSTETVSEQFLDRADLTGALLSLAYPDRVAQARSGQPHRFKLRSGKGAALEESDPLAGHACLVVAHLDGQAREARIRLAAPISQTALEAIFSKQLQIEDRVEWDEQHEAVIARRETRLEALTLRSEPLKNPDSELIGRGVCQAIAKHGLDTLPWTDSLRHWQSRAIYHRKQIAPDFPDIHDAALLAALETWLLPHLKGCSRLSHLQRLDLNHILKAQFDWNQQKQMDELTPSDWLAPTGTRARIEYPEEGSPFSEIRLQEVFGQVDGPRIGRGQPILLHLLSPARRPLAVTDNLSRFWDVGYPEVRKDMRGRYPKHPWPEDPRFAPPTNRAKPRGT